MRVWFGLVWFGFGVGREYQFENCDAGNPGAPSECACIGSNNDVAWTEQSGQTTCLEATNDDWCT